MKTRQEIALKRFGIYVESLQKSEELTEEKLVLRAEILDMSRLLSLDYKISDESLKEIPEDSLKEVVMYLRSLKPPIWKSGFRPLRDNWVGRYEDMRYSIEEAVQNSEGGNELKAVTKKEFVKIPQQIMLSKNSVSTESIEELEWFLTEYQDLEIPDNIPFKEIQCCVMKFRPDFKGLSGINDILRYAFYCLGSDPNLPKVEKMVQENSWGGKKTKNSKWRNLGKVSRKFRRDVMERIETFLCEKGDNYLDYTIQDGLRFYGNWLLLSERLHPGEYAEKYERAAKFFSTLKSKKVRKEYKTWYSKLQGIYDSGEDVVEIAKFLSKRPGEFLRKFDSLIRRCKGSDTEKESVILELLLSINLESKTLLDLSNYYDRRGKSNIRLVNTRNKKNYQLPTLEPMEEDFCDLVKDLCARSIMKNVKSRVREEDLAGKFVYLDPRIKNVPVARNMRGSDTDIPAGTKYPLSASILRFFVYWIQEEGKMEDLDLHAYFSRGPEKRAFTMGFNSSLDSGMAYHSGDVINRPGKCAEFIDIDLDKAAESGVDYIVMDVCNYIGAGLDTLPCWGGYEEIGEVSKEKNLGYVPTDKSLCLELNSKHSEVALLMIDVAAREIIFLDCDLGGIPVLTAEKSDSQRAIIDFFKGGGNDEEGRLSSFDILKYHYECRGAIVVDELGDDTEIYEDITLQSVLSDCTKVLSII